jgi:putative ABC transport system permease protein
VVGQVVRSLHPDAAVRELRTLERVRDDAIAPRRLTAALLLLFAAIATGLTLAGIFGVLSFAAGARAQEMGIRRALGAPSWGVRGMVVREGLAPVVLGLLAGSGVAIVMGEAMAGLVWGVHPRDPLTFASVTAAFLAVSALACWMPARRAAGVDVLRRSGDA